MDRTVLGILGTAKNTGKTTTTTALLEHAGRMGIPVGLTGIGYDGEDLDTITGLPKPRVSVREGSLVATAERCLAAGTGAGTALIETLRRTECLTPLGRILVGRVSREGLVVLGGPNKGRDLRVVLDELGHDPSRLIIADGALNRIVPLMQADALILTTGASRNTSVEFLAREVASILQLFSLPAAEPGDLPTEGADRGTMAIRGTDGSETMVPGGSLLGDADVDRVLRCLGEGFRSLYLPGIVNEASLGRLVREGGPRLAGGSIVLRSPAHLLIAADPLSLPGLLGSIGRGGISLTLPRSLPILAVTVNPAYPRYNSFGDGSYEMAAIDGEELRLRVAEASSVPVIDILREGAERLFDILRGEFPLC